MAAVMHAPSVEEFLEWERLQEARYELIDGVTLAMAGGTADHNTIVHNLVAALRCARPREVAPAGCAPRA